MEYEKLDEKFVIMTVEDLSETKGGFIANASTTIAWGVLGGTSYMFGRYLGSRR